MNPCRLITFAAIVLMGLLPSAVMALDEPHTLRLLGHSTLDHVAVRLDETD
jgi:two-component system, NarL family, sensor histidine kinase EvgS